MRNQPDEPLVRDLHRVLKHEVKFSGTFALSIVIPGCPNPGLDVDGVGRVALPLTDQTAKLIASVGDQAPYGRGTDTIVDTAVRDTIQIDASNIRFMNPKWAPFIQNRVEEEVWSGLGCAPFISPPRCEPYKLLLYKPGAHFLPHQDTEKAPGMFATLVIVLPSEFTGGEIHVSHGGENKIFDNAKDSAFETTILAWYTDVTHEVKEITSGYRLALSYHLINASPGIGSPHLPSGDSSLQHLREIFSKWSNNEYPSLKGNEAVAYRCTHMYSDASLREVVLKGEDQHLASILKDAGDSEGVLVLMGWLNASITGCTADHGWQTYEGHDDSPEFGCDRGTRDSPVMSHVYEAKMWVDGMQDMQGREAGIARIELGGSSILPYRAFSGLDPGESTLHEGYFGNEGANVEFMYKCAALVVFPKERQLSLILSSEGVDWGLEELEKSKSEGPSKENREIIDFVVQQGKIDIIPAVLKVALEWNDAVVWGSIVEQRPGYFLGKNGYPDLWNGWQAFKLDGVRSTFEELFQAGGIMEEESIKFLLFVKERLPFGTDPQKDEWVSTQAVRAMETFTPKDHQLISVAMDTIRWKGLGFASSVVLPRFSEEGVTFDHWADFGVRLIKHKEELIALPRAEGQTGSNAELLDHILDEVLVATIPQVLERYNPYWPQRVLSLLSICIPGNRMKAYGDLLDSISRLGEKAFYTQYVDLYGEIIPGLVKLLGEHGISISSSPSRKFFDYIIGTYLEEILGSEEGSPFLKFSMLTCGHEVCSGVNDFLRSEETTMTIEVENATERCVRGLEIDERYHLFECRGGSYRQPPRMELTKKQVAMAAQHWSVRLSDALELLKSIGTDEEISRIMGERYPDVEEALKGSRAFVKN